MTSSGVYVHVCDVHMRQHNATCTQSIYFKKGNYEMPSTFKTKRFYFESKVSWIFLQIIIMQEGKHKTYVTYTLCRWQENPVPYSNKLFEF